MRISLDMVCVWVYTLIMDTNKKGNEMNFETFKKEYTDTFKRMMSSSPKQAGSRIYAEKMADLEDAYPEWAEIVEEEG